VRLANLVSYTPKRNEASSGFLKVFSITTTENITDYNGINLSNITVNWNDPTNPNWNEQFTAIINASLASSQRIGRPGNKQTIVGVETSEYNVNLVPGYLPVINFSSVINGVSMPFEAINATSVGKDYIYEPSPVANAGFNLLYRNDKLGFAGSNTGYFFYFKQGTLQNVDFNLAEKIANRTVNINVDGINNLDRWLFQLDNVGNTQYQWRYVENVFAAAAEQLAPDQRKLFSVTSRANDQITLTFGDGVFSENPVGLFRCYVRASNGLNYIINPEEMQSVVIPISYISRSGQLETMTFTCGITQPVSNAMPRETIDEIKQRAPARYYTQNRMVNGEDYNNFPFTLYNSIIKSHALNRSSIGTSRYLDLVDNTGKYSSTNTFSSDGAIWKENDLPTFLFSWLNRNDIADIITNKVGANLVKNSFLQFYYANYPRANLLPLYLSWHQSTTLANETSGYFVNSLGYPVSLGNYSSSNTRYIKVSALVKFEAPYGYFFNASNRLTQGTPTGPDEKYYVWCSPTAIVDDGTNQGLGNFSNGIGPVTLNNFIPTGAIPVEVIPLLITDLTSTIESSITEQILLNRNFGLGYDNITSSWYLITSTNLSTDSDFSLADAESTAGTNSDASWLVQFTTDGYTYTVKTRALVYNFGSVLQTRFFFETNQQIYDSRTGTVISDFVRVLRTNSQPDSNYPLYTNIDLSIIGQPVESDGYVDDYQVIVSYQDSDGDGIADDPDFFEQIVNPTYQANKKLVFFEQIVDFDNLQRYLLVDKIRVNSDYPTLDSIELVKLQYVDGQIFYAYNENTFYKLSISVDTTRILTQITGWKAQVGRQDLYFQYRHNSPLTSRIDPGTTNIIDLYVVTQAYYTAYQNWIKDSTGTVPKPPAPTLDELNTAYQGLNNYKMISDNVVLNSVTFKPLFGAKAADSLRATIKVIRAANSTASDSEIKNLIVTNMNTYFSIDVWNFGDTFYFSELAAYLHDQMGGIVSSIVLVPLNPQKSFGDLYEIRSAPNEIFVNAAGVDSVEVITALTSTNIRTAPGSGVI
jgi:hypothetical protein